MNQAVIAAMRLIEAFVALIVGRPVPITWDDRASIDATGTIHLPRPRSGDAAEVALLTRLAVHEAGHELRTQKGFADRLDPLELRFFNVLEDPRMEREQCSEYPGAGLILSRGMDEMLARLQANLESGGTPAGNALQLDLLIRGYLEMAPHEAIQRRAPRLLELLAPGVSDNERLAADAALAALPSAQSSLDGERIAQALVARLRQKDEPQEDPQPESEPPSRDPAGDADQQQQAEPERGQPEETQQPDTPPASGSGAEPEPQGGPEVDVSDAPSDSQVDEQDAGTGGEGDSPAASDAGSQADGEPQGAPADSGGAGDGDQEGDQDGEPQPGASGADAGDGGESDDDSSGAPGAGSDATAGEQEGGDAGAAVGGADASPSAGGSTQPGSSQGAAESGSPEAIDQQGAEPAAAGEPHGAAPAEEATPGEGDQPGIDLGSLLRQTLADEYGSGAETCDEVADIEPLSDDELQRVRVAVSQQHDDLDKLLEATLLALAPAQADAGEPADACALAGGASMAPQAGAASGVAVRQDGRLQGVQSRLVNVLQRELQDRRRRPRKAAHAGGRILPQRFWRLGKLGDTKVFAAPREVGGIDAAACLLVDASQSMRLRLQQALEVTMAFSLALQRLNVRTKVVRFPASEDAVVETLQGYGESPRACAQRCVDLSTPCWTPIGAAATIELQELLQQRRLKNILAIVTDDAPGDPDLYLAALEHARANDVLVIGVGIGCSIRDWVPESIAINDVNELPDALAGLFRSNIVQKLAA